MVPNIKLYHFKPKNSKLLAYNHT